MTENGTLVNPNKEVSTNSNPDDTSYRYDDSEQRRIEYNEQKRRTEEEQRKLQQLEEELRRDTTRTTTSVINWPVNRNFSLKKSATKEGFDDEESDASFIHSPVFSLMKVSL